MTKQNRKEYTEWLTSLWNKYKDTLGLGLFLFELHEIKETLSSPLMECKVRYPYLEAHIGYSESSFKMWQDDKQKAQHVFIHEMCHVVTDPFYVKAVARYLSEDCLEAERERLTDLIAVLVCRISNK